MGRRFIRLKEFNANLDYTLAPDEGYSTIRGGKPELKQYRIRTDGNGFILSGRQGSDIRIVGLGDSVLECLFVEEESRICARLEEAVSEELGQSITILNGGYSGATSLHILNTFMNKIVPLKPHAVFLMTGIMDLEAMFKVESFWSTDGYLRPVVEDEANPGVWDQNFRQSVDAASRAKIIALIIRAGAMFNIPVCCLATPHLQIYEGSYVKNTYPDPSVYAERIFNRRSANEAVKELCALHGLRYFETQHVVAEKEFAFCDDIHLNQVGTHAIVQSIMSQGFGNFVKSAIVSRQSLQNSEEAIAV